MKNKLLTGVGIAAFCAATGFVIPQVNVFAADEAAATTANTTTVAEKAAANVASENKVREDTTAPKAENEKAVVEEEKTIETTATKKESEPAKAAPVAKEEATPKETPVVSNSTFNTDPEEESPILEAAATAATASTSTRSEKGRYIKSIDTLVIDGWSSDVKKIKFTINTTIPFSEIYKIEYFNAKNGEKYTKHSFESTFKKINDTTFEATTSTLSNGDWRLFGLTLTNNRGKDIVFNQYDLNSFKAGATVNIVTKEPNTPITLADGQDFNIVPNKNSIYGDDFIKYTLKIRGVDAPLIDEIELINDRTGIERVASNSDYRTVSYLDENNNAIIYFKYPARFSGERGVLKINKLKYKSLSDNKSGVLSRNDLLKYDNSSSVSLNGAKPEPNYIPNLGNKKTGVFTNYSQVEEGTTAIITIKTNNSIRSFDIIDTDTLEKYKTIDTFRNEHYIDSNGNQAFFINTSNFAPGNYTIGNIDTEKGTISEEDLNLTDAAFSIIKAGDDIPRLGTLTTLTPYPTGWIKEGNAWYYKTTNGAFTYNVWIGNYYIKSDGSMASNEWFKVDNTTYYAKADGSYATDAWVGDKYVKANGAMASNEWFKVDNTTYYAKADGSYATNTWVGNYYVKANGAMAKNEWVKTGNTWYYTKADGTMATNEWFKVGNSWYYAKADGSYAHNEYVDGFYVNQDGARENVAGNRWTKPGNTWYYVKANGDFAHNTWIQGQYYVKANGAMATNEWFKAGNSWYYAKSDGSYARSEYVDGFYVNSNGTRESLAGNKWTKAGNSWYYVKGNGDFARNTWVQGRYYVKANGKMAANEWVKVGNTWYYTKADGAYASNEFRGNYFLKANGAMAKNETFYYNGKEYTADANGYVRR